MDKIKRDIQQIETEPDARVGVIASLIGVVATLTDRLLALETRVAELEDRAERDDE
jgi:hypothetical protein